MSESLSFSFWKESLEKASPHQLIDNLKEF